MSQEEVIKPRGTPKEPRLKALFLKVFLATVTLRRMGMA